MLCVLDASIPLSFIFEDETSPRAEEVIEGRGIVKNWGSTSVHRGLDFEVGRGVTGLLGSNGAGKTTLLGMVLGLHRPNAGELRVFGLDPTTAGPEIRARLGYSPEHHTLPPDVRAHDLVRRAMRSGRSASARSGSAPSARCRPASASA